MDPTLIGAIIGASAAVTGQLITAFLQSRFNAKQQKLAEFQLRLSANQRLSGHRLEALILTRSALIKFKDSDIDALKFYQEFTPLSVFLNDEDEAMVSRSVSACMAATKEDKMSDKGIALAIANLKARANNLEIGELDE